MERCPNCHRLLAADNQFCPNCGHSRDELREVASKQKELRAIERENRRAWSQTYQMIGFYGGLLSLNFLAAYVLPLEESWAMLAADCVLIGLSLAWVISSPGLLRGRLRLGLPLWLFVLIPFTASLTYGITIFDNFLFEWLIGLRELREKTEGTERFLELAQPLWILVLSICVVPGIFEELFFRGLIQGTLEMSMSSRDALIVQALIFAIAHVNFIGFFTYLLFMGLYLGWLRNRSGSLLPGMLVHFGHNLLAVLHEQHLLWN
jgi:membrane protease YdiL (CAAX protease family)